MLSQLVGLITACLVDLPMTAPVCRGFWMMNLWAAVTVAVAGAGLVVVSVVRYHMKLRAALRAQAARDHIDYEAIEAHSWKGETS